MLLGKDAQFFAGGNLGPLPIAIDHYRDFLRLWDTRTHMINPAPKKILDESVVEDHSVCYSISRDGYTFNEVHRDGSFNIDRFCEPGHFTQIPSFFVRKAQSHVGSEVFSEACQIDFLVEKGHSQFRKLRFRRSEEH